MAISVHRVLAKFHGPNRVAEDETDLEELDQLLSESWHGEHYANTEEEDAAFLSARSILRYYVNSEHARAKSVIATEVPFEATDNIGGYKVKLSCRADRIELHDDGVLEILDYKTSASGWTPSTQQLTADPGQFIYFKLAWGEYSALEQVNEVCVSWLNLVSLRKVTAHYNQRDIVRNKSILAEIVSNVENDNFPPRPHQGCERCPLKASCPAFFSLEGSPSENQ
jgi:hypothetical protein